MKQFIVRVRPSVRQRGVAMLGVTLVLLVAMTVMTGMVARMTITSQRMAANTGYTEAAFQAAEAEIDNVIAYLNRNRGYIASPAANGWFNAGSNPKWTNCSAADTSPPCGDGTVNLYGNDWLRYGPVPNLAPANADYQTQVYLLSDNINTSSGGIPWLGCLNLQLTALLPGVTAALVGTVNTLLNLLMPGLGLPPNLCLPLNFSGADAPPPPGSANPTIRVIANSNNAVDVRGGAAVIQQDLQTVSRFARDPMAPLMVMGVAQLRGDIRIWGNARPPTRPPQDWSILNLNDVLGLNITNMLGLHLNSEIANLAPLLNLSVAETLALDWNVTFPLSIWSDNPAQLHKVTPPHGPAVLNAAPRTCAPQFGSPASSTCLVMSVSLSVGGSLLPGLGGVSLNLKLPDVQDPQNLGSAITGLLDTSAPVPAFPDDLFEHVFGIPADQSDEIKRDAVVLANCAGLGGAPAGLYWVTGDCDINGSVGSAEQPMLVVAMDDVNMAGGSEFWGVIYQAGPANRRFRGSNSGTRPTLHGALLSDHTRHYDNAFNLVYDNQVIRRAGYRAGHVTRLPGGWNDGLTGS